MLSCRLSSGLISLPCYNCIVLLLVIATLGSYVFIGELNESLFLSFPGIELVLCEAWRCSRWPSIHV